MITFSTISHFPWKQTKQALSSNIETSRQPLPDFFAKSAVPRFGNVKESQYAQINPTGPTLEQLENIWLDKVPYGATPLADNKVFFKVWAPNVNAELSPIQLVPIEHPPADAEKNRKEIVQAILKYLETSQQKYEKTLATSIYNTLEILLPAEKSKKLYDLLPEPVEREKKLLLVDKLLSIPANIAKESKEKAIKELLKDQLEWLIREEVRRKISNEFYNSPKHTLFLHQKYHKNDKKWAFQLIQNIPNHLMALHLQQIARSEEIPVMPDYVPVNVQEKILSGGRKMQHRGSTFYCIMEKCPPNMRYMYLVNGELLPDPHSRYQPKDVHGPSQVVNVERFDWGKDEKNWRGAPNDRDLISYRLHIGTFSQEGTFKGAIQHLDKIKALGFNTVELFPITEFPGDRNWGYDPANLFAVENAYGGPTGLMAFIKACHEKGLAVILDTVYNHFSPEGNYLNKYDDKFTVYGSGKAEENCGGEPNWAKDEVKQYILNNAKYWLKQYHADGFRLDLSHKIPNPVLSEIGKITKNIAPQGTAQEPRHIYLSAEDSRAHERDSVTSTLGMNARWDLWLNNHITSVTSGLSVKNAATSLKGLAEYLRQLKLRKTVVHTESADGMHHGYRSFDRILSARVMNAYLAKSNYPTHSPNDFHHHPSAVQSLLKDFNLSESVNVSRTHGEEPKDELYGRGWDYSKIQEIRKAAMEKGFITPETLRSQTLFTSLLKYVLPGQPLHLMGEEYGAKTPFHFFTSYMDKTPIGNIQIDAKRKGLPEPMRPSTFSDSKLDWQNQDAGFLKATQDIIHLRKTVRALRQGGRSEMAVDAETYQDGQVMTIHRWGKDPGETKETSKSQVLIVLNRSDDPFKDGYNLKFPPGNWHEIFNADAKAYGGQGALNKSTITGSPIRESWHNISLRPWNILVFEKRP